MKAKRAANDEDSDRTAALVHRWLSPVGAVVAVAVVAFVAWLLSL